MTKGLRALFLCQNLGMLAFPYCTTKNTILDGTLAERFAAGDLLRLEVVVHPGERVCYVAAFLTDEPRRPIYLATRRDRKHPKLFVDQTRLTGNLARDYPGARIDFRTAVVDQSH